MVIFIPIASRDHSDVTLFHKTNSIRNVPRAAADGKEKAETYHGARATEMSVRIDI